MAAITFGILKLAKRLEVVGPASERAEAIAGAFTTKVRAEGAPPHIKWVAGPGPLLAQTGLIAALVKLR